MENSDKVRTQALTNEVKNITIVNVILTMYVFSQTSRQKRYNSSMKQLKREQTRVMFKNMEKWYVRLLLNFA